MSCDPHCQFTSLVEQMGKLRVDELESSPSARSPRHLSRPLAGSSSGVSQAVQNAYAQRVAKLEAQLQAAEARTERAEDLVNSARLRTVRARSRARAEKNRADDAERRLTECEGRALHAQAKALDLESRRDSAERKAAWAEASREAAEKRAAHADTRRAAAERRVLDAEIGLATAQLRCETSERKLAQSESRLATQAMTSSSIGIGTGTDRSTSQCGCSSTNVSAATRSSTSHSPTNIRVRYEELTRRASELNAIGSQGLLAALHVKMSAAQRDWARELDHIAARLDHLEGSQLKCVVCLEPMRPGERVLRLPCMHMFHENCLMPHLRNRTITRCPIDRTDIPHSAIDTLPVWSLTQTQSFEPIPSSQSQPTSSPPPSPPPPTTTSPIISNALQYSTLSVVESTSPLCFEGYSPLWLSDTDSESDSDYSV